MSTAGEPPCCCTRRSGGMPGREILVRKLRGGSSAESPWRGAADGGEEVADGRGKEIR